MQAGHSLTEIALATLEVDNIKMSRYKSMQESDTVQTNHNPKAQQHQQQSIWMRAITKSTAVATNASATPTTSTGRNNHFAILREKTMRALRTLTQSQPRTAWAKTA